MSIEINQVHEDLKEMNAKIERLLKLLSMLVDNTGSIAERMRYR
jgi:hypothetical protein